MAPIVEPSMNDLRKTQRHCQRILTARGSTSTGTVPKPHIHIEKPKAFPIPPSPNPCQKDIMEYEKVRFDRLNQVVKKAVEHTIKKLLMPEQVYKCFPTISNSETGPDALENARKQMQTYFHDTCVKQVEHIFAERDIEQKLNELDEIIQLAQHARDNKSREQIEVDKLAPEDLINSGLGEIRPDSEKKLAMIYDQLVLDNQQLQKELKNTANESRELADGLILLTTELLGEFDEMMKSSLNENLNLLTVQFFNSYM